MTDSGDLYRQIVESMQDGIWIFDDVGRTTYSNARTAELLGRTPEAMQGLPVRDALDAEGQAQFDSHLEELRAGRLNDGEAECGYLRADGSRVWVTVSESRVFDDSGRVSGFLHRLTDYTDRRRLVAALTQSKEQLADAQAITRTGSWEMDMVTGEVTWTDELYRLLCFDRADFTPTAETFMEIVADADRELVREAVRKAIEETGEFEYDAQVVRGDGETVWMRGRGRMTRDARGEPQRLGGTAQDVSEAKEVELQLLDAVVLNVMMQAMATAANESETLGEALMVAQDYLLGHEDWSRAIAVMPSVDAAGEQSLVPLPVGKDGATVVVPTDAELEVAEATIRHHGILFEEKARPQHPSIGFPVMVGDDLAAVIVITANSPFERHAMLRSMAEQVSSQLSRVAERERSGADLAAARDAAMEASRQKSEFLATMSHEIRTPMNGVIGLNDLLLRTALDAHQRRLAEGVQGAGRALLSIINDILDFSKIEAGKLQLEAVEFDVRTVFDQVATLLAEGARDKGIELVVGIRPEVPERLTGDPTRLTQILSNLVSNAVKFTDEGEVVIRCAVESERGSAVVLRVEVVDTGIGIDLATQARLFEPFSQADASTTRTHGGTGLGLAISHQLVAAIGGVLGVDSSPGQGSTFWFTGAFERADTEGPASSQAEERTHMLHGRRALVVDDNASSRSIVAELLAGWEMVVTEAQGPDAALDLAVRASERGEPYDVVLLDLAMPGQSGLELATMIRVRLPDDSPQLLLLSSQQVDAEAMAAAGVGLTLAKPLSGSALFDGLAVCLADAHGAEALAVPLAQAPREHRGEHLLVVEDNEVNQIVALGVLEVLGYSADIAEDGVAAVQMASTGSYDAILMDVQMPLMDGYAASRAIRSEETGAIRVPIIAMTAAAVEGEREKCLAAGMDDFLTKPLEPQRLEAALRRWVAGAPVEPAQPTGGERAPRARVLDPERLEMLAEMGSGASALIEKAVTNFISRAPTALEEIRAAVHDQEPGRLKSSAHRLKGSALNLGAAAVGELCLELELMGDAGRTEEAPELIVELEEALRSASDALRDYQHALAQG